MKNNNIGVSEKILLDHLPASDKFTFEKLDHDKTYEAIIIGLDTNLSYDIWQSLGQPTILSPTTNISYIPESLWPRVVNIYPNQLSHITATAEHAFCLFMMACRHMNNDILDARENWMGRQLSNMKAAVFGYGRTGRLIAKYCQAFGIRIQTYDKANNTSYKQTLLTWADVVFVCMTYNKSTENFFNIQDYDDIKEGQILVNTSRAQIVNKRLIVQCLENKKWQYVCMDFINQEDKPHYVDKDYKKYYDQGIIIMTPHIAGNTHDSLQLALEQLIKNFEEFNEKNSCSDC